MTDAERKMAEEANERIRAKRAALGVRDLVQVANPFSIDSIAEICERRKLKTLAEDCPSCEGVGSETARSCWSRANDWCKHHDALALAEAEAQITETRRRRLERAGVQHRAILEIFPAARRCPDPKDFAGSSAAAIAAARQPMAAAAGFLADRSVTNLLLRGTAGSGKTWAAAWVVAGTDGAVWLPFSSVAPNDDWSQKRRAAVNASLLVLNDLGAGPLVQWRDAEVEALVVERDDASLRTVVTTNLTPETIAARFGDRLHRRLTGSSGRVVECVGPDLSARRT
jgi:DNA replication protein DnaC